MTEMLSMRTVGGDTVEPHPGGIIKAFARIGYKLTEAVADIVDNSVDAGARNVLVRFFCSEESIRRIVIADDGCGMADAMLLQSMQFGVNIKHTQTDLGKFGIGMKSASFSQCRCLSVVTMSAGEIAGRRWTIDSIRAGWRCEKLHPDDCQQALSEDWGAVNLKNGGTLVFWDELDRVQVTGNAETAVRKLFNQLRSLGIVYHRFLERKKLSIVFDMLKYGETPGIAQPVMPVNPFGYTKTGDKHYPKRFKVKLGRQELPLVAHIWPARVKGTEYSLGGSAAARQGFYFYRNDRLIQMGGWNKLREHETDPHLSLARVSVDLPPAMDSLFHLDVQKSSLDVPPGFDAAVRDAKAGGVTWADYIKDAERVYRRGESTDPANAPIVLGGGISKGVRSRAKKVLTRGEKRQRKVTITWMRLPPDVFFDIDRDGHVIKINEAYRNACLGGGKRSSGDGALVKTLLFLLLRDEFNRERIRQNVVEWIDGCNKLLIAAVADTEA